MARYWSTQSLHLRCRRLIEAGALVLVLSSIGGSAIGADVLIAPFGPEVQIDGVLSPGEWDGAASMEIQIRQDWRARVWYQHDANNLYFAFQGLQHGKEMRFPELLLDPNGTRSRNWQKGQFWLHSSFNLCEGEGEYNVYERSHVFQCSKEKKGWSANHFPLDEHSIMEIQVSLDKLGIPAKKGVRLGFALDLTDTQKNWTFWPATAQLAHPSTWGTIRLE